jgi:hypothetical protein
MFQCPQQTPIYIHPSGFPPKLWLIECERSRMFSIDPRWA